MMSYVLEGIVFPKNDSDVRVTIPNSTIDFDQLVLDDNIVILARPGRPQFDEAVCEVAVDISKVFGEAMVVRWDDRIGFRESRVYRGGFLPNSFSVDNELYVMLDDDGMPLRDGKIFEESELDDYEDDEFEVYQNALELGCENAGFCSWVALHRFIQRQG
tara:strand:- start:555 stop:1034 length:480 start_codon:yes stop_codon:yes gene_type:complete